MKTLKTAVADAIASHFAILMWWLPGIMLATGTGYAGAPIVAWLFAHNVVVMVRKAEERGRVAGATTTAKIALSHLLGTSPQVPPEQALRRAASTVDTMRRILDRGGRGEP